MLWGTLVIAIANVLTGFFYHKGVDGAYIGFGFVVVSFFEFASGPITWLYMSEIMQDKSQSIATALNWTVNLLIGFSLPKLVKA